MADAAVRTAARSEADSYADGADLPLGSFAMFMAAYVAAVVSLGFVVRRSGRRLPERFNWSDVVLMSFATHKIARLVAKDPVTSPVRAPFTRFSGTSGPAE